MKIDKDNIDVFEESLQDRGYRRFSGHLKSEDYGYWKSFHTSVDQDGDTEREYQIAILFYDFTKYDAKEKVSIAFEFVLSKEEYVDRMDFSISDDNMTVERFEETCEKLYHEVYVNYVKIHNKK